MLRDLLDLLFPPECLGCAHPGVDLCESCASHWARPATLQSRVPVPIYSTAFYSPEVARIIIRAKDENNREARKILAQALDSSLARAISERGARENSSMNIPILIPIPSSMSNNRRRGFSHLALLSHEMKQAHIFLDLLSVNRRVRDQSRLSSRERMANLEGAFTCHRSRNPTSLPAPSMIVIFDDLFTTGSSLREAVRALKVAKISPEVAISACAVRAPAPIR